MIFFYHNNRQIIFGTSSRNRTGTPIRISDFKSEASTYSAIEALIQAARNPLNLSAAYDAANALGLIKGITLQVPRIYPIASCITQLLP